MIEKKLGVVICNFNKKEYLKQCISSVLESDLPDKDYQIVVVDNASTDGAPQMVKEEFSNVILLENTENTGGSGGFARGMQYAIDKGYEYVALLDNDIKLDENTLSTMLDYLARKPKVGVVGAKICQMDHPDLLQEFGSFIDQERFDMSLPLRGKKDTNDLPEFVDCDYVPACCFIARKKVLAQAGVFDARHFIYWDDMDWCTRVRNLGYKIHAIKNARVLHEMGTKNNTSTFGQYYFRKNQTFYFLKHLNGSELERFIDKRCDDLVNITYFSSLKGSSNSAICILLGIDDLERGMFGRQDDRALPKENVNMFERLGLDKNSQPIVNLCDVRLETTRRIVLYLSSYFLNKVKFIQYKNLSFDFSKEFPDSDIVNSENLMKNDLVFYECEHILDYDLARSESDTGFVIDEFYNLAKVSEMPSLVDSYVKYKDIFNSIYKPVFKEKLFYIKEKYLR